MKSDTIISYVLLIVVIICCLFLNQYLLNNTVVENFYQNNSQNNDVTFYFFSMKGCPHCTNVDSSGEFTKLANEYSPKEVNNRNVFAKNIEISRTNNNNTDVYFRNSSGERIPGTEAQAKKIYDKCKNKISGYPSFLLIKDGNIVQYDSGRDYNSFTTFINNNV